MTSTRLCRPARRSAGAALLQALLVLAAPAALPGAARAAEDPADATQAALQAALAQAASQPRPALVARETWLQRAEIADVRLSPDGSLLSFIRRSERGLDVWLQDVPGGEQTRIIAGLQRAETAWSGDGGRLWVADEQGLAVIERADLAPQRILAWDSRLKSRLWAVDARAPRYAVIYEAVAEPGVARHRYLTVDPRGKTRLLLETAWPLRSVLLDADGGLAFAAAFDGPQYETVVLRYTAEGPRELLRVGDLETCRLAGYTADPEHPTLWLLSQRGEDKVALQRWRQDGEGWETVQRDPQDVADADALLWSAVREDWLAIAFHGGRRRWIGNDGDTRARLAELERQLPDANLQFSVTNDGQLWLVEAQQGDLARNRHYLYRPEQGRPQALFADEVAADRRPQSAAMHPVSYRASDGMLLHGYVLLPDGVAPGSAPLVAWLHGGPVMRLYDEYNAGMQLLVNRGCAVFLPNFRVSSGYGLGYVLSANGEVGNGRVLADILDGLDVLLEQGLGDRDRQAVIGMSFGGYASLLALSHHPARFRFAFAGAPPTDYGWTKQWQAEHESESLRIEGPPLSLQFTRLGFRYEDAAWRERMQRESPLAMLPALQAPAYIWAGERDDRVPLKSIVHYVGEARRLDKLLCLLIDPDGGHNPASALATEASLYLIELAAHRHFGTGLSPVSPELQEYLRRNVRVDFDSGG
jgi:dipeptidyl aminopeptidase/acylaminoacyl peptidase